MKEQLVNYETAKLAKEKGFNWKCSYGYMIKEKVQFGPSWINNYNQRSYKSYSAPTQSFLQKWIRDIYGINIKIDRKNQYWAFHLSDLTLYGKPLYASKKGYSVNNFETYEKALEQALIESLKLINNDRTSENSN